MRRTMLFLPGNNPNMIVNGGLLGSDSIILDLEDAVSPDNKDAARNLVAQTLKSLKFPGCEVIVRLNGLDTPYWKDDLKKIIPLKPDVVMPTKVSGKEYIETLDAAMTEYYIPTTLKLLNAYDRMDAAGVSGTNIDGTMGRIEQIMDTVVSAFDRQLDALFGDEALDISTDITVLENLLAQEGLSGDQMTAQS